MLLIGPALRIIVSSQLAETHCRQITFTYVAAHELKDDHLITVFLFRGNESLVAKL